jgi:hypothetical protein
MRTKLFLKTVGKVRHLYYAGWGIGQVIEEKHSRLPGGFCFMRILLQDGKERSFINDRDNAVCCYYAGVRLLDEHVIWEG